MQADQAAPAAPDASPSPSSPADWLRAMAAAAEHCARFGVPIIRATCAARDGCEIHVDNEASGGAPIASMIDAHGGRVAVRERGPDSAWPWECSIEAYGVRIFWLVRDRPAEVAIDVREATAEEYNAATAGASRKGREGRSVADRADTLPPVDPAAVAHALGALLDWCAGGDVPADLYIAGRRALGQAVPEEAAAAAMRFMHAATLADPVAPADVPAGFDLSALREAA